LQLVGLLFVATLVVSACSSDKKSGTAAGSGSGSSSSSSSSFTGTVPNGGTLIVGAEQEPDCLDWVGSCSGSSWGYWMVAVNTLPRTFDIVRDDSGKYVYKASIVLKGEPVQDRTSDGKQRVTYQIADNAVWNDNQPITSTDLKYTWDQIANGTDVYDKTGYTNVESVDDSNPKTAVVTFKAGQDYGDWKGLFVGNYGILPSHILQGQDRDAAMKDGYTFSGGPWILEAWNKTDNITLVPNPNYFGPKPHMEKVIFKFQPDTSSEFTAFKSNQVSMIYPQPQLDAVDQINAGLPNTQKTITTDTPNFESLWLNMGKPPFDDIAVRKAVSFSIDRAAIVERLFGALGVKDPLQFLNAQVVKDTVDQQAFAGYKLDLNQVNTLMTGAGYAKGSDGIWAKNGQKVTFAVRSTAGNKRRELTEQVI